MRLLGLDLGEREIRVAHGERRLGTVRLTALERIPLDGAAPSDVLARLARRRPQVVVTALPAASVTHRILALPFRDRRRLARTVPFELLGRLPLDPEDVTVAYAPLGEVSGGTAVLAAAARRADVAAHVALLAAAGLPPVRVDLAPLAAWNLLPDALGDAALLLADGQRSAVSVRRGGRLAGLRALAGSPGEARAMAAEVRWSLQALGGIPPTLVVASADAGADLGTALATTVDTAIVPFPAAPPLPAGLADALPACAVAAGLIAPGRRDTTLTLHRGAEPAAAALRSAAGLAAAALVLAVLDWGLVRHGLARRDALLRAAIHTEAAAVLPGGRLVAPRAELAAAVETAARRQLRRPGGAGTLSLLRELSTRVPPALRLDLDELVIEPDGLGIHGRAESFDAVDALRRGLAASPLFHDVRADETRTTVDGRQVEFRLRAARQGAGAPS
jgi:type II secretion system protein L